jgi:hypothetical protein
MSSNLEKAVTKSFKIAEKLHQAWVTADYYDKQRLQYLIFPEGMQYDKKNNEVRTSRLNSIFCQISMESSLSEENKKGNLLTDCLFGSSVGRTGIKKTLFRVLLNLQIYTLNLSKTFTSKDFTS